MKSKSGVAVLAVVFIGMFFSLVSYLVGRAFQSPKYEKEDVVAQAPATPTDTTEQPH